MDYDINYAEPEKNNFTGLKRAEIIETARLLIALVKAKDETLYSQSRHVADLSYDLNEALASRDHFETLVLELGRQIDQSKADRIVAQDTLLELDKRDDMLATALTDALNATPALLKFTVKMAVYHLRGEIRPAVFAERYKVTLFDCRPSFDSAGHERFPRISCIKVVRQLSNLGLREAKELCDPSYEVPPKPCILASGLTQDAANRWEQALKESAPTAKFSVERE
jgi:hypothetical protein